MRCVKWLFSRKWPQELTPISDVDKRVFIHGSFNLFLLFWMVPTSIFVHSYFRCLLGQYSNSKFFRDQLQPIEMGKGKVGAESIWIGSHSSAIFQFWKATHSTSPLTSQWLPTSLTSSRTWKRSSIQVNLIKSSESWKIYFSSIWSKWMTKPFCNQ